MQREPLHAVFSVPPLDGGGDRCSYGANKMDVIGRNRPRLGVPRFENAEGGLLSPNRDSDRTDDPAFTQNRGNLKALLQSEIVAHGWFSGPKCITGSGFRIGWPSGASQDIILPTGYRSHPKDIARGQMFYESSAFGWETIRDN
jgi:hypothetical protein